MVESVVAVARILVAEDEAIVAMELEHRLHGLGYEICGIAATGSDAVARARATTPDILLFDIRLRGDVDGIEAATKIQRERPVPVVFLSAYSDTATLDRVRALDHSSYLLKPFDERMLHISLDAALYKFRVAVERDREESERRRSDARLAAVLDYSPDAIVSLGPDRRIVVFNRGAEQIFGFAASEVLGKGLELLLPEGTLAQHREQVEQFSRSGEHGRPMSTRREVAGRRKNGEVFAAEGSIFRMEVGGEEILTVILRDVSDRKRLEARSLQAQKLEAVGRLAAGVAHDFNNLLSTIRCSAYLASLDAPTHTHAALEEVLLSVDRGAALTRQMLAFVSRAPASPQPTDVNLALSAMERLIRTLAGAEARVQIHLEVGAGVAALDVSRFEQMVMNLVVNARDAMPRGGTLAVKTRARTIDAPRDAVFGTIPSGRYVEVAISDTGTGIAAEHASRIFEPFFTTKPLGHGTGLGLMTVSEVVRAHEGHLEIESKPGAGSTFRTLFPAVDGVPSVREPERPTALSGPAPALDVLVVDDDDTLRAAIARILAHAGFTVTEAQSVEEALRLANDCRNLDVVVSDVMMPSMTGPALLALIRDQRPTVGAVLMSGYAGADVELAGSYVSPILRKPFLVGELVELVRAAGQKRNS